jgi:hypothetical protein
LHVAASERTSAQAVTRPSTSGQTSSLKPNIKFQINRSNISKRNSNKDRDESHEKLEKTLNKYVISITEEPDSPVQLYYKSIEPYLKKKKHISGYEADPIASKQPSESQSQHSEIIKDTIFIDPIEKARPTTRENWFKNGAKMFSKISEEETISDKNSYGFNLAPRKTKKKPKIKDIKTIVASFF